MPPVAPSRLAFVGQRTYFEPCALEAPAGGWAPRFFDLRPDEDPAPLRAELDAWDPDVVIAFRPDLVPAGALAGMRAARLGWLTEPLPRDDDPHPDLAVRLEILRGIDAAQFDRIVAFDPLIVPAAESVVSVWRSVPLPVADGLFAPITERVRRPALLFVGRSTAHRESFLGPLKHSFDVVHLAHGLTGDRLAGFMAEADVAVNLHNEPYPTFENRVQASLAAGLLVLSEPLSPRFGLRPGSTHLEAAHPAEMWDLARRLDDEPGVFRRVRVRGRQAAERFRASRVLPRLADDLRRDVAVFGRT